MFIIKFIENTYLNFEALFLVLYTIRKHNFLRIHKIGLYKKKKQHNTHNITCTKSSKCKHFYEFNFSSFRNFSVFISFKYNNEKKIINNKFYSFYTHYTMYEKISFGVVFGDFLFCSFYSILTYLLFCDIICWPYRVSELTREFKCVLLSVNSHPMCSHFTEYY